MSHEAIVELQAYVNRLEGRVEELSRQLAALQALHQPQPHYQAPPFHTIAPKFNPAGLRITCGPAKNNILGTPFDETIK